MGSYSAFGADAFDEARDVIDRETGVKRRRLVRLIYTLGSFTEERLFNELSKEGHEDAPSFDLQRSLRDYLRELTQLGVLEYRRGIYSVR